MATELKNLSRLRLVFLLWLDDPEPWEPVAVQPSTGPGTGQDLAELKTLEAEAAPVSKVATRALVTFVAIAATVCENVWTQFLILDTFCKNRGSCK